MKSAVTFCIAVFLLFIALTESIAQETGKFGFSFWLDFPVSVNNDLLENYELCSFDFTKSSLEYYNIPNQQEIFPLKRLHYLIFNQNGQLLFFDNEVFHRYDFNKKELTKINKGVVLSPLNSWILLDFGYLNKNLYMLGREDDKIKLFFIAENELNEMKLMEENIITKNACSLVRRR